MKKISLLVLTIIILFLIVNCEAQKENHNTTIKQLETTAKVKLFEHDPSLFPKNNLYNAKLNNDFVKIYDTDNRRNMVFNNLFLQSSMSLKDKNKLVLAYTKMMMVSLLFNMPKTVCMLGFGGGSMTNFLYHNIDNVYIDAVEIDENIVKLAKEYFYFKETDRYKIYIDDAYKFLKNSINKYDLIILDVFSENKVPEPFMSMEFLEIVKAHLTDDGLIVSNLYHANKEILKNNILLYREVFGAFKLFKASQLINYILLSGNIDETITNEKLINNSITINKLLKNKLPFEEILENKVNENDFNKLFKIKE